MGEEKGRLLQWRREVRGARGEERGEKQKVREGLEEACERRNESAAKGTRGEGGMRGIEGCGEGEGDVPSSIFYCYQQTSLCAHALLSPTHLSRLPHPQFLLLSRGYCETITDYLVVHNLSIHLSFPQHSLAPLTELSPNTNLICICSRNRRCGG